jgi:hypothetical protein
MSILYTQFVTFGCVLDTNDTNDTKFTAKASYRIKSAMLSEEYRHGIRQIGLKLEI